MRCIWGAQAVFSTVKEFETNAAPLSSAEVALINACRRSKPCILNGGKRPEAESDATAIRASLLRLLVTGASLDCGLGGFGVHLEGAWITEMLDLSFTSARGRTTMDSCYFTSTPNLVHANLLQLSLKHSLVPGLDARAVTVEGAVLMQGLVSIGEVNLPSAQIGHKLDLDDAKLEGKVAEGKWRRALYAERARVGNSIFLRKLHAVGSITLVGVRIGGVLSCTGSRMQGKTSEGAWNIALNAERATIGATVFLKDVRVIGKIAFNGAQISGQLVCEQATMDGKKAEGVWDVAFRCERMEVKERFVWRGITVVGGRVNLSAARVGYLDDDLGSWPQMMGQVRLDGFVYQRFTAEAMAKTKDRITWLGWARSKSGAIQPQPYTQLARTLRSMGHDRGAEQVLIERERLMARQTRLDRVIKPTGDWSTGLRSGGADFINAMSWALDALLRGLTGYGYRAHRCFLAVVVLFFLSWVLAAATWSEGSFAPNSDVVLTSSGWQKLKTLDCLPDSFAGCVKNPAELWSSHEYDGFDWDTFHPAAYAADLVVPILNLGQTDAWAPSRDRGPWGALLWWVRWLFTGLGLGLTALGTAAMTKIIQKDRE